MLEDTPDPGRIDKRNAFVWRKLGQCDNNRSDPLFVLRNGVGMLRHTFRGSNWRSMLGLESSRAAFTRYRAIRARERHYLDWPDPFAEASTHRTVPKAEALPQAPLRTSHA